LSGQRLVAMQDLTLKLSQDWSGAERGKFYRLGAIHDVPLYLDSDVFEFLAQRARARGIEPRDLANEMLKKNIELVREVESE
jgi:hypothetical protein